jgi:hypothetical protein
MRAEDLRPVALFDGLAERAATGDEVWTHGVADAVHTRPGAGPARAGTDPTPGRTVLRVRLRPRVPAVA